MKFGGSIIGPKWKKIQKTLGFKNKVNRENKDFKKLIAWMVTNIVVIIVYKIELI